MPRVSTCSGLQLTCTANTKKLVYKTEKHQFESNQFDVDQSAGSASCITGFDKVHHSNVRLQTEHKPAALCQLDGELMKPSFSIQAVVDERCN